MRADNNFSVPSGARLGDRPPCDKHAAVYLLTMRNRTRFFVNSNVHPILILFVAGGLVEAMICELCIC